MGFSIYDTTPGAGSAEGMDQTGFMGELAYLTVIGLDASHQIAEGEATGAFISGSADIWATQDYNASDPFAGGLGAEHSFTPEIPFLDANGRSVEQVRQVYFDQGENYARSVAVALFPQYLVLARRLGQGLGYRPLGRRHPDQPEFSQ